MNFIKNPQNTIALTFLTHIISGIGGVYNAQGVRFSLNEHSYFYAPAFSRDIHETLKKEIFQRLKTFVVKM